MRLRGWVIGLAAGSVLSAGLAFWNGLRGVTVVPPVPPSVCPMVRAATLDLLVPGHGKPVDETFSNAESPWMRGTACFVENGSPATAESLARAATMAAREVLSRL